MNQPLTFNLSGLTHGEAQLLIAGLDELPHKHVRPLVDKVLAQLDQQAKEYNKAAEEAVKPAEKPAEKAKAKS